MEYSQGRLGTDGSRLSNLKKQILEGSYGQKMDYKYSVKKAHVHNAEMELLQHFLKVKSELALKGLEISS